MKTKMLTFTGVFLATAIIAGFAGTCINPYAGAAAMLAGIACMRHLPR